MVWLLLDDEDDGARFFSSSFETNSCFVIYQCAVLLVVGLANSFDSDGKGKGKVSPRLSYVCQSDAGFSLTIRETSSLVGSVEEKSFT